MSQAEKPFRKLRYTTLAQAMQEAERVAAIELKEPGRVTNSGRFSVGQVYDHLAKAIDMTTGHLESFSVPWYAKIIGPLIRPIMVNRPTPRGIKLPSGAQWILWSRENVPLESALEHLRTSVARFAATDNLLPHPLYGKISMADHHQFQCRHFELHLGYLDPQD